MPQLGFIGVGSIGYWMADRLQEAGNALVVHDTHTERARQLLKGESTLADSPKAVADSADIVFLSLPTPDALKAVASGQAGLAAGSSAKLIVDLSTVGPDAAIEVAALLQKSGKEYLDAPVSGGIPGAKKGTVAIMVAGSDAAYKTAVPFLEMIGRPVRVGDMAGKGQVLKLLNNYLSGTAMAATAEAMAAGVHAGLDPAVMLEVFNASSGRNTATSDKFPRSVLDRSFDYGFRTALFHKDVRLCKAFADGFGAPFPVLEAVDRAWEHAAAELGDKDFTRIIELLERPLNLVVGSAKETSDRINDG